ncbi:hypothetical protein CSOJ01_09962 [Colletotrichum sojae]|uniref:Uncharacterized protein n=1 Tax=Colletotrichum sojae TaxID=2175907 RepID=A0A8H6J1M3_9PEZI|nr:hypothetical protein CSOJ01_09962 [Colletotrichum sojae]
MEQEQEQASCHRKHPAVDPLCVRIRPTWSPSAAAHSVPLRRVHAVSLRKPAALAQKQPQTQMQADVDADAEAGKEQKQKQKQKQRRTDRLQSSTVPRPFRPLYLTTCEPTDSNPSTIWPSESSRHRHRSRSPANLLPAAIGTLRLALIQVCQVPTYLRPALAASALSLFLAPTTAPPPVTTLFSQSQTPPLGRPPEIPTRYSVSCRYFAARPLQTTIVGDGTVVGRLPVHPCSRTGNKLDIFRLSPPTPPPPSRTIHGFPSVASPSHTVVVRLYPFPLYLPPIDSIDAHYRRQVLVLVLVMGLTLTLASGPGSGVVALDLAPSRPCAHPTGLVPPALPLALTIFVHHILHLAQATTPCPTLSVPQPASIRHRNQRSVLFQQAEKKPVNSDLDWHWTGLHWLCDSPQTLPPKFADLVWRIPPKSHTSHTPLPLYHLYRGGWLARWSQPTCWRLRPALDTTSR